MKLLNLFSGTGSVSKPWRKEHEVWDVDIDPRFGPETCEDILQWDYKQLPWIHDAIWASPPCTEYARCRTRGPPRNFKFADSLVAKALESIHYFEQKNPALLWFLENGDSTLLWGREVAKELTDFVVLDYCHDCAAELRLWHYARHVRIVARPARAAKESSQQSVLHLLHGAVKL